MPKPTWEYCFVGENQQQMQESPFHAAHAISLLGFAPANYGVYGAVPTSAHH